jgi:hypothetical protein
MIFFIDGQPMPAPTAYSLKHSAVETVFESVGGKTLVKRSRSNKRTLSVSWDSLSASQYALIRAAAAPVSVSVNFRGENNQWIKFDAIPSDFSATLKRFDDRSLIQNRWAINNIDFSEI